MGVFWSFFRAHKKACTHEQESKLRAVTRFCARRLAATMMAADPPPGMALVPDGRGYECITPGLYWYC